MHINFFKTCYLGGFSTPLLRAARQQCRMSCIKRSRRSRILKTHHQAMSGRISYDIKIWGKAWRDVSTFAPEVPRQARRGLGVAESRHEVPEVPHTGKKCELEWRVCRIKIEEMSASRSKCITICVDFRNLPAVAAGRRSWCKHCSMRP